MELLRDEGERVCEGIEIGKVGEDGGKGVVQWSRRSVEGSGSELVGEGKTR